MQVRGQGDDHGLQPVALGRCQQTLIRLIGLDAFDSRDRTAAIGGAEVGDRLDGDEIAGFTAASSRIPCWPAPSRPTTSGLSSFLGYWKPSGSRPLRGDEPLTHGLGDQVATDELAAHGVWKFSTPVALSLARRYIDRFSCGRVGQACVAHADPPSLLSFSLIGGPALPTRSSCPDLVRSLRLRARIDLQGLFRAYRPLPGQTTRA